jgi:hypothetical protein
MVRPPNSTATIVGRRMPAVVRLSFERERAAIIRPPFR